MYAVAGVTGHTGRVAAEELLRGNAPVRVIVRDAAKGEAWKARGAEVAVADLADAHALAAAFEGVRAAYVLVPPQLQAPSLLEYQRAIAEAIRQAAIQARLPHLVLLSSIGAELDRGTGPIRGLHDAEARLGDLPATRPTFIRAAYFMENFATQLGMLDQGVLPTFVPEELPIPMVATRDIGRLAARTLREGPGRARVVYISAARPYSHRDAADALSRILGRPIRAQRVPLDALVPTLTGMGLSADVASAYREMMEAMTGGRLVVPPGETCVTGETDLETVLRELVGRRP
ncbi:MAG TPA: NmrA family NAD(P)-binding protein [Vicinamibacterales bacterium]|nr:NmrA family NAD(P)-binding protein [Vicinamibacterales bacterium]